MITLLRFFLYEAIVLITLPARLVKTRVDNPAKMFHEEKHLQGEYSIVRDLRSFQYLNPNPEVGSCNINVQPQYAMRGRLPPTPELSPSQATDFSQDSWLSQTGMSSAMNSFGSSDNGSPDGWQQWPPFDAPMIPSQDECKGGISMTETFEQCLAPHGPSSPATSHQAPLYRVFSHESWFDHCSAPLAPANRPPHLLSDLGDAGRSFETCSFGDTYPDSKTFQSLQTITPSLTRIEREPEAFEERSVGHGTPRRPQAMVERSSRRRARAASNKIKTEDEETRAQLLPHGLAVSFARGTFRCPREGCSKSPFRRQEHLTRHMNAKHPEGEIRRHACPVIQLARRFKEYEGCCSEEGSERKDNTKQHIERHDQFNAEGGPSKRTNRARACAVPHVLEAWMKYPSDVKAMKDFLETKQVCSSQLKRKASY